MKNLLNKLLISLAIVGVSGAAVLPAAPVMAQKADICKGLSMATGQGCNARGGPSVQGTVRTVIIILSWIVGVVAVIMIIIGGLKYITSTGDAAKVTSAKNTILYAIVGLVVVALAQVIVRFVLNQVG